jgi:hypothetical protein
MYQNSQITKNKKSYSNLKKKRHIDRSVLHHLLNTLSDFYKFVFVFKFIDIKRNFFKNSITLFSS